MRILAIALLSLLMTGCGEQVRIAVGQSRDEAVALIKKHGGADITSGMEIAGNLFGAPSMKGLYWEFDDFDAVIRLSENAGTISGLSYWTKKDFSRPKLFRSQAERPITAFTLHVETKRVVVEDKPETRISRP